MKLFKTVPAYFMQILYLFLYQLLKFRHNSVKPIEKLSRQHFINSVSKVLGQTVVNVISAAYIVKFRLWRKTRSPNDNGCFGTDANRYRVNHKA